MMPIGVYKNSVCSFKLDALCQGQLFGVVDGACGPSHVLLPGVRARLAAAASGFLAAEGAPDLGPRGGNVDVDNATVGALGPDPLEEVAHILGEEGGAQPLLDLVVPCDGLVEALALEDVDDGGEGLAVDHGRVVGQAGHDGRLDKVAALPVGQVVAAEHNVAAERLGLRNRLLVSLDADLRNE